MKAVILESYVMEPGDLDWSGVKALVLDKVGGQAVLGRQ